MKYDLHIDVQPTESTCGGTCLAAIYRYFDKPESLTRITSRITELANGGVLGVQLGLDALKCGFTSQIFTFNLKIFDPTWFLLPKKKMIEKLKLQQQTKKNAKLLQGSSYYTEFLERGGTVLLQTLTPEFLHLVLKTHGPIITGLSATYLYRTAREIGPDCDYDDIAGEPQGHFVVLTGMSADLHHVHVADPHEDHPLAAGQHYTVPTMDLINAILLGVLTYDANLIVIQKPWEESSVCKT